MPVSDWLPSRQHDLLAFGKNFDTLLNLDPGRYGTTAATAAGVHVVVDAFEVALAVVDDSQTRSPTAVTSKNIAMAEMSRVLRIIGAQVRANVGVAPEDKQALGIHLPDTQRTPVPAPTTVPILAVLGATPLEHTMRYADQNTPTRRARAVGASGMQLVRAIGEAPPAAGADAALLVAVVTRQPFAVRFEPADAKKTAYYWGRWQTASGLVGPWSAMVSMVIAA